VCVLILTPSPSIYRLGSVGGLGGVELQLLGATNPMAPCGKVSTTQGAVASPRRSQTALLWATGVAPCSWPARPLAHKPGNGLVSNRFQWFGFPNWC
jgi:hypothetical protein